MGLCLGDDQQAILRGNPNKVPMKGHRGGVPALIVLTGYDKCPGKILRKGKKVGLETRGEERLWSATSRCSMHVHKGGGLQRGPLSTSGEK